MSNFLIQFLINFERSDPKDKRIMKKLYQKPEIQVVRINHSVQILAGSGEKYYEVTPRNVKSDGIFEGSITGSSTGGRSRGWDDWDDEDW